MGPIASRLAELGITLPEPPKPVASYVGFVREGNLVFVSGQLPFLEGKLYRTGILGTDVSVEDGAAAARICAINLLAQARNACGGDVEKIVRCVRLGGFVACTPAFIDHPKIINGASDLMAQVLGEAGQHARTSVGVASLPMGACVEVEAIFAVA
jgi:enamine deaminase RidA (YjgF/YER057c/UK114 family)